MPTVSTVLVFITCAIAASEKRNIRCYDILSAFVNTDVEEDMLVVLKGELADMMIQIATQTCRKYVTVDKRECPFYTSSYRKLCVCVDLSSGQRGPFSILRLTKACWTYPPPRGT